MPDILNVPNPLSLLIHLVHPKVLVILQFFPRFSNVSPALAALPLLVVLAITGLKDGYEDLKRHQSDRSINNLGCHVLAGPSVHNPNLTVSKSRRFSIRWLGDLLPSFGSKAKATKRAVKESQQAAQDLERPDDFDQADRQSLSGGKKTWWGRKKRTLPRSSKNSSNKAMVENRNVTGRPNVERMDTYLTDDDGEEPIASHQIRHSGNNNSDGASTGPDKAHWRKSRWEDLRVGDFIRLKDNESIPAGTW